MNEALPINLVRLKKYSELTGDPIPTVKNRMKTGAWLAGKHYIVGPDRRIWVNLRQAQEWVTNGHLKSA